MSVSETARDFVDETVESMELATRINGFHLEPRCRVCRNDVLRKKVNDMLATGASYAMIVRALSADNTELAKSDRVTIDSIRTHTTKHFPVQSVAKATYRAILERRARENQVDFVEGVATALLPVTFFEVVMNKAFRTLVDDGTEVSVETGLRAAEKLQSVLDGRERGTDVLELKVQLGRIGEAVRAVVPQSMWAAIVEQLEELEQHSGRSTSARTPSMTMTPTIPPSSSTRTMSFDLRGGPTASSDRRPRHRRPSCWRSILTAGRRPPRPRRPRIRAPVDLAVHGRVACLFSPVPTPTSGPRRRGVQ